VSAVDTWEFKTVTVAGDTSGTWLTDSGIGLSLNICIAGGSSRLGTAGAWAGSDYSGATSTTNGVAATSDTFQITGLIVLPGIELPASDRAPLIMRPFDHEVDACKRYYEKSHAYAVAPGTAVAGNGFIQNTVALAASTAGNVGGPTIIPFKRDKRGTPAYRFYDFDGTIDAVRIYPGDVKRAGITLYAGPMETGGIQFLSFNNSSAQAIGATVQLVFAWTADARL
jgi:hypothetical protein